MVRLRLREGDSGMGLERFASRRLLEPGDPGAPRSEGLGVGRGGGGWGVWSGGDEPRLKGGRGKWLCKCGACSR